MGKLAKTFGRFWNRTDRQDRRSCRAGRKANDLGMRRSVFEPLEDRRLLAVVPETSYLSNPFNMLSESAVGDPLDVAMNYLRANAGQLSVEVEDLTTLRVTDRYTDADTGVTHIYMRQALNGLDVIDTDLNINITRDGQVINVGSTLVAGLWNTPLASLEQSSATVLSAVDALDMAAQGLELPATKSNTTIVQAGSGLQQKTVLTDPDLSISEIQAGLHYVSTPDGVKLAWGMQLFVPGTSHDYDLSVDASSGEILRQYDLTKYASYNVYPMPVASPFDPDGVRQVVTDPADANASPYGWHDDDAGTLLGDTAPDYTYTRGNNVYAQTMSGGYSPDGGASLNFNYPINPTQQPTAYTNAAVTNMFYWINTLHDVHFAYGFNEVAGSFQTVNYSGAGGANDAVLAYAQDYSRLNNASFGPAIDGTAPTFRMGIFTNTNPYRDSDLDSEILVHEYGHGVSSRLVGGKNNVTVLQTLQGGGMAEGWSDWWSLMFTQKPTDTKYGAYSMGTYSLGQPDDGPGGRRYPYSFDMSIDPLTYSYYSSDPEIHSLGEIWCSALWDLNWLLIDKYGYEADISVGYDSTPGAVNKGNILALKLVMDSLKLMPTEPTFVEGRDVMLRADAILTGGQNAKQIWEAFARRGMGIYADAVGNNAPAVQADFTMPPDDPMIVRMIPNGTVDTPITSLQVWFSEAIDPTTFSIANDVVAFTNPLGNSLLSGSLVTNWVDALTLEISNIAPTTLPGQYTLVLGPNIQAADNHHLMDQDADGLPGENPDDRFTGTFSYTRSIGHDDYGYKAVATNFINIDLIPADVGTTTVVEATNNGFGTFPLGENVFRFYGQDYNAVYASANGLLTFLGSSDTYAANGNLAANPSFATIAPLWDDWTTALSTAVATGDQVLARIEGNRLIVEWNGVPNMGTPGSNATRLSYPATFQAILELNTGTSDGSIWLNYRDVIVNGNLLNNGASATVGIKSEGVIDPYQMLLSQNTGSHEWLRSQQAVKIVHAAEVSGQVFSDLNANGVQDAGDVGLANWTIYADANNNSILDAGEEYTNSDSTGGYKLEYLSWGDYVIREIPQGGWTAIVPAGNGYSVSLVSGDVLTGLHFANQPANHTPVFPNVSLSVEENRPQGTLVGQVAASDVDAGQQITYAIIGGNTGNAFVIDPTTGQIRTQTPAAIDFETGSTFSLIVRATDNGYPNLSATAVVTISVINTNDPPSAAADVYATGVNIPLQVPAPGVLNNDSDIDHDELWAQVAENPLVGTLTLNTDGSFIYTPDTGFIGTDHFRYRAVDTSGGFSEALVSIDVGSATESLTLTWSAAIVSKGNVAWEAPEAMVNGGRVSIPAARATDTVVTLRSKNVARLNVPATVTIPAGQLYADFTVTAVDNSVADGSVDVVVVAAAPGLFSGVKSLHVGDNEAWSFGLTPISSPQIAGEPFLVTVEARNISNEKIDTYAQNPAFKAKGDHGDIAVPPPVRVGAPQEQPFVDGQATYYVTVGVYNVDGDRAVDTNVVLTVYYGDGDGDSNAFNTIAGPLDTFRFDTISSPQAPNQPITATISAVDKNGFTTLYSGSATLTGAVGNGVQPTILISEVSEADVDSVELQNVSNTLADTDGWVVAMNDSSSGNASAVYQKLWQLPATVGAGALPTITDDPSDVSKENNERQRIAMSAVPTGGTWTITFRGATTLPIGYDASVNEQQQIAFTAVPTSGTWTMSFRGATTSALSFNERQRIAFSAVPTSGNWTISYGGATTVPLGVNSSMTQIANALNTLSSISGVGGSVTVTSDKAGTYDIEFGGSFAAQDVPGMVSVNVSGLTPAVTATVTELNTAARIKEALDNLPTIGLAGGSVTATAVGTGAYQIEFFDALGGRDVPKISVNTSKLPLGVTATVSEKGRVNQEQRLAFTTVPTSGTWTMSYRGATTSALSFNEQQRIAFSAAPTSGNWSISYGGFTTGADESQSITVDTGVDKFTLAYNGVITSEIDRATADAAAILAALNTIPALNGNVVVTGGLGGPYQVQFTGALSRTNVAQLVAAVVSGSSGAKVTIDTVVEGSALPYNATADQVRDALNLLPSIGGVGGSVIVTSSKARTYEIEFGGTFAAQDVPGLVTVNASGLSPAVTATVTEFNTAARIKEALDGLSSIGGVGGSVIVTSVAAGTYQIDFGGTFATQDIPELISVDTSNLPGVSATVAEHHTSVVTQLSRLSTIGGAGGSVIVTSAAPGVYEIEFHADLFERQRFVFSQELSGGTWSITYGGATTSALPYNATTAQIKAALDNLTPIGGMGGWVVVNNIGTGAFEVEFHGKLSDQNLSNMVVNTASLETPQQTVGVTATLVECSQVGIGSALGAHNVPNVSVDTSHLAGGITAGVEEFDAGLDAYLGGNLPWGPNNGKGWVMVLDSQMNVVDFVAWGYTTYQIQSMRPVINGKTLQVLPGDWNGTPVAYGGSQITTLQRLGDRDGNTAADFTWLVASADAQNTGMQHPFASSTWLVSLTNSPDVVFTDGKWEGPVVVSDSYSQLFLRAQDLEAHVGVSNAFDVRYTVPVLADTPGLYDPSTGLFLLRDSSSMGFADHALAFGPAPSTWTPLVGDWDGDGATTIGLYEPTSSTFFLSNSLAGGMADIAFGFGAPQAGWLPLVGDWDGNGQDSVGLFDPKTGLFYLRNTNTTGPADVAFGYGAANAGWTPLVGDWNGDGVDSPAFYIPSASTFFLRNSNSTGMADYVFGFGAPGMGWEPLVGDWDGEETDSVAMYDPATAMFYQTNSTTTGYAANAFAYGAANRGWIPLAGNWNGTTSLLAAADAPAAAAAPSPVTQPQLDAVVDAALARWASLGLEADVAARLANTGFRLGDLPGNELGRAEQGIITIDPTAAGHGWFVDPTPLADEEFLGSLAVDQAAVDRMDLLTVVEHELGHVAGLDHEAGDGLMSTKLSSGVRRAVDARQIDAVLARGL